MTHYRVIEGRDQLYRVQWKPWWLPIWLPTCEGFYLMECSAVQSIEDKISTKKRKPRVVYSTKPVSNCGPGAP